MVNVAQSRLGGGSCAGIALVGALACVIASGHDEPAPVIAPSDLGSLPSPPRRSAAERFTFRTFEAPMVGFTGPKPSRLQVGSRGCTAWAGIRQLQQFPRSVPMCVRAFTNTEAHPTWWSAIPSTTANSPISACTH